MFMGKKVCKDLKCTSMRGLLYKSLSWMVNCVPDAFRDGNNVNVGEAQLGRTPLIKEHKHA